MEVKINKEIRNYTESMYFGLSLRQCVFAVLAIGASVGMYFILRPFFGLETLSWVCVIAAAPFAAVGFIKYHGMSAEKFIWAYIKSEFLTPKQLTFKAENLYYALLTAPQPRENKSKLEKRIGGKNAKDTKKHI